MWRNASLLFVLGLLAVPPAWAQGDDDCEPAVDMIESNDAINRISECDYSDQGLSGWLSGVGRSQSDAAESPAMDVKPVAAPEPQLSLSVKGIGDGLQYVQQRFTLLQEAAQRCAPQQALIARELVSQQGESLTLYLQFSCYSSP
ncbi:hypothetical protein QWI17_14030 [Gilvimarinus sp. SDUM040013]|uniref:Uncharacterized protein n=1 Tax=Gilvimarinus gilvus TaxID=3058038 RepID=A0ABU4RTD5_9GAMM|nr:hypothetical protein [Gilvimarinus sp. SDUM040013]MDO3386960.1 hypothetical protein [Gilvimarinus sp. SDUM040013]MDX6848146.1 hypothetical protein [Gilvimarinus sp. SDUM040013]